MSMNSPDGSSPQEALLRNLLERVARREVTVDEAVPQVRVLTQQAAMSSGVASLQAFTTILQPAIQRQKAAAGWIVGIIFALLGTIFLCVGVGINWRSLQFLDAPKTEGEIVSAGRSPTAKYEVNGREYRVTSRISQSPPPFNQGEKCTVLYKADNPSDAQIDIFVERWLFMLIFGGIGGIFALIGYGILFFKIIGRMFGMFRMPEADESQRFTVEG